MKLFRLVWYRTKYNKFDATDRFEYLGDMDSVWQLWYILTEKLNYPHVEVNSMDGTMQKPENGTLQGMCF